MTEEPVSLFPNDQTIRWWREREEPAAVLIRCDRGKRPCDVVASIFRTPGAAVVVFHQHLARQKVSAPDGVLEQQALLEMARWDGASETGLLFGRVDEAGTVVALDNDDYWHDIVEVSCRKHLRTVHLTRAWLMDQLRRANRREGVLRVGVSHTVE